MYGGVSYSGNEAEKCPRCGTSVYGFSKKYSVSVGDYYCIKCAEALDRDYLARTTCAMCGTALTKDDVKFVMSSKFFSASGMPLADRLICPSCHSDVVPKVRDYGRRNNSRLNAIRLAIRKGMARRTYAKS